MSKSSRRSRANRPRPADSFPPAATMEPLEARLLLSGGLCVTALTPTGGAGQPFQTVRLQFNQPVQDGTFTAADVTMTGPGGPLATVVNRIDPTTYDIVCAGAGALDNYSLVLGPDIRDLANNQMDQNHDGTPGQAGQDAYSALLDAAGLTISAGNTDSDGWYLVLYGGTSTIDGDHAFGGLALLGGATLTHSADTDTTTYGLDLTIRDALTIDSSSRIDVSGMGYLAGRTHGNSTDGAEPSFAGGSYGGVGDDVYYRTWGDPTGTYAPTYGDFSNPTEPGAGSAYFGTGGGLVRISAGSAAIEGAIVADGTADDQYGRGSAGGAGGGIRLDVGTLSGSGSISANGGSAIPAPGEQDGPWEGSGGGGRVAVYYQALAGFDLAHVQAVGGNLNGGDAGAAGTVYLQQSGQAGQLRIDSHASPAGMWTPLGDAADSQIAVGTLLVNGAGVVARPEHQMPIVVTDLTVSGGAVLGTLASTASAVYSLDITATGTLTVAAGSAIDVTGMGYLADHTTGNTVAPASGGGSYGGVGYYSAGLTYGDYRNPTEPGAGGWGDDMNPGGAGGGLVRISAGVADIEGSILADGVGGGQDKNWGCSGSGGAVWLDVGTLQGAGTISADGGSTSDPGGGGRIAIYYDNLSGFDLANAQALGGSAGNAHAAPGTVYLGPTGQNALLRIDNGGAPAGMWTPLGGAGDTQFAEPYVVVSGTGVTVRTEHQMPIIVTDLTLGAGATLTCPASTDTVMTCVDLTVTGTLTIAAGAKIDASGTGYLPGRSAGNSTDGAAGNDCGGSYGGLGGATYNVNGDLWTPGDPYGDYRDPAEPGAGGGAGSDGAGGGLVRITATAAAIDGSILAAGGDGWGGGAGSGGGIRLDVGTLSGAGTISANGGGAYDSDGGGGGGRVAVYYDTLSGFDLTRVRALAGPGNWGQDGSTGSVYLKQTGQSGQLIIDSHGVASANWTPLGTAADTEFDVENLVVRGANTVVAAEHQMPIVADNVTISGQGNLAHRPATDMDTYWLDLTVTGTLDVQADGTIDVSGLGYLPGRTSGNSYEGGASTGAGSYGGVGMSYDNGINDLWYGRTYGDYRNPTEPGSGGGVENPQSGSGGGLARIVAGTAVIDGSIVAVGGSMESSPAGSGGGIRLDVGTLSGAGFISVNGGDGPGAGPTGGGGRVAIYYDTLSGFDLNKVTALPGMGYGFYGNTIVGGVGTVYTQQTGQEGELRIDSHGVAVGMWTTLGQSQDQQFTADNVVIAGAGVVVVPDHPMRLLLGSLDISGGAVLSHLATTPSQEQSLTVVVAGEAHLEAGSGIDVSGKGYSPGYTLGNLALASTIFGGSYGGRGGGQGVAPYGLAEYPNELGTGSQYFNAGNTGGGLVHLTAGTLVLDGFIQADGGEQWSSTVGGGAGGGVLVDAGTMSGAGYISARGGSARFGGGGGRVALYSWDGACLPVSQVDVGGGGGLLPTDAGQDGTVALPGTGFYWPQAAGRLFHGQEQLWWDALGVDPATVTMDVYATQNGTTTTLAAGADPSAGFLWDTTAQADGPCQIQAVFHDADGNVLGSNTQTVTLDNAVEWDGGWITDTETWSPDKVHLVDRDVVLRAGANLTIEPGTIVKFFDATGLTVYNGATLNAPATAADPIILTSAADDTVGGDSMMDGDTTSPKPGDWRGISPELGATINITSQVQVRYVTVTCGGTLPASEIWLADSVHYVTSWLTVPDGMTLIISPGAVVKFAPGCGITIAVNASLVAQGSAALPIIFTSAKDDSVGGDTNGDGDASTPASGDWSMIEVTGQATMDHVRVLWGGLTGVLGGAAVKADGTSLTLTNSVIADSYFDGLLVESATEDVTVSNCLFLRDDDGIYVASGQSIAVTNCTFDGNRIGFWGYSGAVVLANSIVTNSTEYGVQGDNMAGPTVSHTDVWSAPGSGAQNYANMPDRTGTDGNISADPLYRDSSTGDYELGYLSPAIDAGDGSLAPATDAAGAPRYDDPRTPNTGTPAGDDYTDMGAYEFVESAPSTIDLTVTDVTGPATATVGQQAVVQWTVTNLGTTAAVGPWHDAVYLSLGGLDDPYDDYLAEEVVSGEGVTLDPGQSVLVTAEVTVPAAYVGPNVWQVAVNTRNEVFEGTNRQNNTADSAAVDLSYPALTVGGPATQGQFTDDGQAEWFCLQPGYAGQDILLSLDLTEGAITELYVAGGRPVSRSDFDLSGQAGQMDQQIQITNAVADQPYYVLAYLASASGARDFTLSAVEPQFGIDGLSPSTGGNVGNVTVEIRGSEIPQGVQPVLVGPDGSKFYGGSLYYVNPTLAYATFDLAGAALNTYDLQLIAPDGTSTTKAGAFQVVAGHGPSFRADLVMPAEIRVGRPYTFQIEYSNVGDTDLIAPIVNLTTSDQRPLGLSAGEVDGLGAMSFLGYSTSGPAGILRPGQTEMVTVYSIAAAMAGASTEYTLTSQSVDPLYPRFDPVNWSELANQYAPGADLSGSGFWETFQNTLGGTWDAVNKYLADLLTQQVQSGLAADPLVTDLMQTAMIMSGERGGGLTDTETPWILAALPYDADDRKGVESVDVIFSKTMDPTTFTGADVTVTAPGGASIQAVVTPVSGRVFTITFQSGGEATTLKAAGEYCLAIGPDIADTVGHLMDQDRDGRTGEAVDDVFTTGFTVEPTAATIDPTLHVVSQFPAGNVDLATGVGLGTGPGGTAVLPGPYDPGLDHLTIQFSRAVQFLTFSPRDVTVTGPDGSPVPVTAVRQLSQTIWEVDFVRQTAPGQYAVNVGTALRDEDGGALDQNPDDTSDQADHTYTGHFTLVDIHGPRVVAQSPGSYLVQTTDHLEVTFSEAIDPASVTPADVTLTGPDGAVAITGISAVNDRTFRIEFAALADEGEYDLTVGPGVTDTAGNEMDQDQDGVNGGAGDVYAGTVMLVVDPNSTVQVDAPGMGALPADADDDNAGGGGAAAPLSSDPAPLGDDPIDKVVITGEVTYGGTLGQFFLTPHVKVQLWLVRGSKDKIPGLPAGSDPDPDVMISNVNALTGTGDLDAMGDFVFTRTAAGGPILKQDMQNGVAMLPQFYVVVIAENSAAIDYDWSARRTMDPGGGLWQSFNPDGKGAWFVPKVTAVSSSWICGPDQPGLNTQVHDLSVQVNNANFGPAEWIKQATTQIRDDFGAAPRRVVPVIAGFDDAGPDDAFYEAIHDVIALGSDQVKYPAAVLHEYGHSIQNSMNGFKGLGNDAQPSSGSIPGGGTFDTPYGIIQESMERLVPKTGSPSDFIPPIYHLDVAYEEAWASFVAAYSLRNESFLDPTQGLSDAVDRARSNPIYLSNNNWWMGSDAYGYTQNWKANDSSLTPGGVAAAWAAPGNGINKDANTGDEVLGGVLSIFWAIANSGPSGPTDLWRAMKAASGPACTLTDFWNALPHTAAYEAIFINNGVPVSDNGQQVDDQYDSGAGNDTRDTAADVTPTVDVAGEPFGPVCLEGLVMAEKDKGAGDWYKFDVQGDQFAAADKTRTVTISLEWDASYGDLDIYAQNTTTQEVQSSILKRGGTGQETLTFRDLKADQTYHFVVGVAGYGALNADGTPSDFGGDYVPDYSLTLNWGGLPDPRKNDDGPKPPPAWPNAWPQPDDNHWTPEGGSHDPNELVGPAGTGADNYIPAGQVMPYTVFFENSGPQAKLPAQEVKITDQLDASLDWSTFAMTEIAFDNQTIAVPAANGQYFHTVVDLSATEGILVDVEAGVDQATGQVFCNLTSLDPNTGALPLDPTLGLLPVNDANHSGEGHVSYVIDQAANLPTGRQITNQASIVFDTNDPIATNSTLNTVDADAPVSQVTTPSASQGADKINLAWTASDAGSGLAGVELYVSDNGAAYQLAWQGLAYSYSYTAQPGHTYSFYTVGIDAIGQREVAPAQADTTVTVWPTQTTTLAGKNTKLTFTDADGTAVTVTYTGLGSAAVETWDNPANGHGDIRGITITNPDGKGTLTITTKGTTAANGTTTAGQFIVNGSLKSITAGTTTLTEGVTVEGLLATLVLGDVSGAVIDIDTVLAAASIKATDKVAMTFGQVSDTAVNTNNLPIASIKAVEWTNTWGSAVEAITAPWIGTITTTGRKGNLRANPPVMAIAGDFQADLALSGVGTPAKAATLGTVKIAGGVSEATWDVSGSAGAVTIAGSADNWTLQGDGAAGAGLQAVKSLTLASVWNATILAGGALGTIKAVEWFGGSIAADSLASLTTTGSKGAAGMMGSAGDINNLALTLRAEATPPRGKATITALGSATIAGSLDNSDWGVDMDAGAITVGGAVSGWTLAGAADGDAVGLTSVKSLTLGYVEDASVTVGGVLGALKALRWATGTIEADSLASLTVSGRKQTATVGAVVGDFGADVVLDGPSPAAKKPAAGAVTIAHDLTGSSWQVTGSMAAFTVTGTAAGSTVRASGSIASLTLGAADGSSFLAGVTSTKTDPTQVSVAADMDPTGQAAIGSLTIKGWAVAKGQPIPAFLTDSTFLAPSLGTVSLLNGALGQGGLADNWDLFAEAQAGATNLRIKSVSYKDTRDPKNAAVNWTWSPGKPVPAGCQGRTHQIS